MSASPTRPTCSPTSRSSSTLGATHLNFGDPDFLNAPGTRAGSWRPCTTPSPSLTFDCTVKVEHVLRYDDVWADFAAQGCLFVVSAFESVDDATLVRLDKGHTTADAARAVALLRAHGIDVQPSFLPFTPWTTREGLVALLDFVHEHDLVGSVDPVQYSIRLLLPRGSLLLDHPDLVPHLGEWDPARLTHSWSAADPAMDDLQRDVAAVVERSLTAGDDVTTTYTLVRATVGAPPVDLGGCTADRPRLTESWFCCAEPTDAQLRAVGQLAVLGRPPIASAPGREDRGTAMRRGRVSATIVALGMAAIGVIGIGVVGIAQPLDGQVGGGCAPSVFVANGNDGNLSVIDTATDTVEGAPITVGGGPIGVAATPDGARVYVTNNGASSVSVVDTATRSVVATIPDLASAQGVAITPDGSRAYVTHFFFGSTVSVIDTATNAVTGSPITVGSGPTAVAFTPDGTRAYVTNNDGRLGIGRRHRDEHRGRQHRRRRQSGLRRDHPRRQPRRTCPTTTPGTRSP